MSSTAACIRPHSQFTVDATSFEPIAYTRGSPADRRSSCHRRTEMESPPAKSKASRIVLAILRFETPCSGSSASWVSFAIIVRSMSNWTQLGCAPPNSCGKFMKARNPAGRQQMAAKTDRYVATIYASPPRNGGRSKPCRKRWRRKGCAGRSMPEDRKVSAKRSSAAACDRTASHGTAASHRGGSSTSAEKKPRIATAAMAP